MQRVKTAVMVGIHGDNTSGNGVGWGQKVR